MSKLDAKQRKALPSSDFAIAAKAPGSGSYPINDASHARNALSRVAANGSPSEQARVRAKVHAKFPGIGKSTTVKGHPRPTGHHAGGATNRGSGGGPSGKPQRAEAGMEALADQLHPVRGR